MNFWELVFEDKYKSGVWLDPDNRWYHIRSILVSPGQGLTFNLCNLMQHKQKFRQDITVNE